ncbi:hypothetical protein [Desertibacillus haloalkaliphilus]|uniref:hypothetical protein n=1 Tax=Desertibacillus haloalkaliphilus TaxID=1328930 RepID=UPI001C267511|nr:hypothetical protein [Desertibacillus haloalkaliphilus]MBU8905565.1 hypothetical protein [Desertibacillus haloalkaliphilus]
MTDQVNITEGQNEFSKRDHITMVFHYGQIDRWVSYEKGDDVIHSDNAEQFTEGHEVKLSETVFMKWMKLTTMVDRTMDRKEDFHVRNKVTSIAKMLGYSSTRGLYKVLKPLYEVGLVDLKETKVGSSKMIDIIVYPYPVYADTPICNLMKVRSWEKRESFGMALSYSGVEARNKSTQESEQKCTGDENESAQEQEQKCTGVENKSAQGAVNKSTQEPVHKSAHTNIYNLSNTNKSSNINNHLSSKLDPSVKITFQKFADEQKMSDDEMTTMIDRLIGFVPNSKKYSSHKKYYAKTLKSIRDNDNRQVRKDKLPKSLQYDHQETKENQEPNNSSSFEEEKQRFEEMLAQRKKQKEQA